MHRLMEEREDIESFLTTVDKISELVANLKSSDAEVQQKAMEDADCYMTAKDESCRTKANKTTINTNPPPLPSCSPQNESPEILMKIMEREAEERRLNRTDREKKATALKDKGNAAYVRGDYKTAVKYYSDGLAVQKILQLFTNRAQAYIKLGKYTEAIEDCEWALRCNEKCIKAYFHMGKAYLALKKYNESRHCFENMMAIEPGSEKMVKEYLSHVDSGEERETQEMNAKQAFDKGAGKATIVPQLLEKLSEPGQMPLHYSGGLEILLQAVTDCTGQTLFRLNNGFAIISGNDTVRSCLLQETKDARSRQLCVSVLKLWRVICCGNDENQKVLMTCPVTTQATVCLVTSEDVAVQTECLALLHLYSQTPNGRHLAIASLDVHMLVRNLMAYILKPMEQQENTAVNILENFAAEKKFCSELRNVLTECVIVPFTSALQNISKSNRHILPSLISAVGYMARDDINRHTLAHDSECWRAFLIAIRHCIAYGYKEILYPLLGLIINLSSVTSPTIQEHAVALCACCRDLLTDSDGGILTRATGVLSNVLPQSSEAVQHIIHGDVVRTMCHLLKGTGHAATKYAIKTLTVCTAVSHLARAELVKSDKKLSIVRHLLGSSCDDTVSGNAALCLAHCFELEGAASGLLGTDIVMLLLRHAAGDAKTTAVRQNAAIALGRLCQSEPRHISRLRELHGFEVLHSCVKHLE